MDSSGFTACFFSLVSHESCADTRTKPSFILQNLLHFFFFLSVLIYGLDLAGKPQEEGRRKGGKEGGVCGGRSGGLKEGQGAGEGNTHPPPSFTLPADQAEAEWLPTSWEKPGRCFSFSWSRANATALWCATISSGRTGGARERRRGGTVNLMPSFVF